MMTWGPIPPLRLSSYSSSSRLLPITHLLLLSSTVVSLCRPVGRRARIPPLRRRWRAVITDGAVRGAGSKMGGRGVGGFEGFEKPPSGEQYSVSDV